MIETAAQLDSIRPIRPARKGPVRFVDTSLRDGNQSLWGATGLTTGMVEAIGPALDRIGLEGIDFTSSTNLLMGAKTHDEDPWERIARMRSVTPNTRLSAITTGMRFMSWDKSSETVMRMALQLMAEHGLRRLQIAEPMNDIESALKVARWAREEGFEQIVAATTFTESPVHTDGAYVVAAGEYARSRDIDSIYLKDPGGLLTVDRSYTLLPDLINAAGEKTFELHSHCTTGEAPLVYLLAAQLGVDVLHTGIGALSNGTAQPQMQEVLDNLDALKIDYSADREAVDEASTLIDEVARSQNLEPGRTMRVDLRPHQHQVPGGMMGTLKRQLAELKLADRLPRVVEEVQTVRKDLGYPIMVTPFSQFVGSQALMNVLAHEQDQPSYSTIPDEVIRFVLGHFGTPQGEINPEIVERAANLPRTSQLNVEVAHDLPKAELRQSVEEKLGRPVTDEELLLRLVMAPDILDRLQSTEPAPQWQGSHGSDSNAPVTVTTAFEFIQAVDQLSDWRSLSVQLGDSSITLQRPNNSGESGTHS